MYRNGLIGALIGMAILIGPQMARGQDSSSGTTSSATSQIYIFGVFRENIAGARNNKKNCWVQAMVTGSTINGELLVEELTLQQAQAALQCYAQIRQCANEQVTPVWATRLDGNSTDPSDPSGSNGGGSNSGGSNGGWANNGGSGGGWSNGGGGGGRGSHGRGSHGGGLVYDPSIGAWSSPYWTSCMAGTPSGSIAGGNNGG